MYQCNLDPVVDCILLLQAELCNDDEDRWEEIYSCITSDIQQHCNEVDEGQDHKFDCGQKP